MIRNVRVRRPCVGVGRVPVLVREAEVIPWFATLRTVLCRKGRFRRQGTGVLRGPETWKRV